MSDAVQVRDTPDTPLRRQLLGSSRRPTALDALREAQLVFQAGQRLDMQALARTLGVDRATLYRWVGSREHLLVEVLWNMMSRTVRRLRQSGGNAGRPLAGDIDTGMAEAASTKPCMQRLLEQEGELALRLLTTRASVFQQR